MNVIDSFKLTDKVAFVTGGGRGIGKVCALGLAEAGAHVAVVDLLRDEAETTAEEVRGLGRRAAAICCDVTQPLAVKDMVDRVVAVLGGLDIAFNNAGICIHEPAEEMSDESWLNVVDVDLNAVFFCARAAGKVMIAGGGGCIINTASMSGQIVNRPQPQCAYNAAKAGVIQLTKSLATEWASHGIRVNCISPGYTGTEMTMQVKKMHPDWIADSPMRRLAEPDEIKGAVVFLASPAASFVTGHDLVIDGAFTCW